jgi:hypothetical protein
MVRWLDAGPEQEVATAAARALAKAAKGNKAVQQAICIAGLTLQTSGILASAWFLNLTIIACFHDMWEYTHTALVAMKQNCGIMPWVTADPRAAHVSWKVEGLHT